MSFSTSPSMRHSRTWRIPRSLWTARTSGSSPSLTTSGRHLGVTMLRIQLFLFPVLSPSPWLNHHGLCGLRFSTVPKLLRGLYFILQISGWSGLGLTGIEPLFLQTVLRIPSDPYKFSGSWSISLFCGFGYYSSEIGTAVLCLKEKNLKLLIPIK